MEFYVFVDFLLIDFEIQQNTTNMANYIGQIFSFVIMSVQIWKCRIKWTLIPLVKYSFHVATMLYFMMFFRQWTSCSDFCNIGFCTLHWRINVAIHILIYYSIGLRLGSIPVNSHTKWKQNRIFENLSLGT